MTIPSNPIAIDLASASPTALTVDKLKEQLTNIGLTCDQAAIELLADYIDTVKQRIPNPANGSQAWSILQPGTSNAPVDKDAADLPGFDSATGLVHSSVGNWAPNPTALGYATTLEYIQYPSHFNWLKQNRPEFLGVGPTTNSYKGSDMTVDAIKTQFEEVATNASSVLVNGLNREAIESALSNAIAPLQDSNSKDYDNKPDSRVFFLVDNYNPSTKSADGIGVLTVAWKLHITDYATKKGPIPLKHDYELAVTTEAVMYDQLAAMNADYAAVKSAMKDNAFPALDLETQLTIPSKPTVVTVFPTQPPANENTFNNSLPVLANQNEATVLVLYAPDLENIGSIDNSRSQATASYSKAVSSGFTFSTTQTLTTQASFEVSIDIVKAGVSVGLSLSLTEEWSKTTTETISFDVPAGAKSFLYQGFLLASVLRYDAKAGTYAFGEAARCLSPILVTSATPLEGAASITPKS